MAGTASEATSGNVELPLRQAVEEYLGSLPETGPGQNDLRRQLKSATPEDLTKQLEELQAGKLKRSKRFVGRMKPCIEQLQRFSKVIEICIQSNPEAASLIWGGLKLLLQLASEFAEFFEKLVRMIQIMTNALPNFTIYMECFPEDGRLREHVTHVLVDIFRFWGQATAIFVKSKDGVKQERSSFSVAWEIMRKPFDSRFKEIIDRYNDNCSFIDNRIKALRCRQEAVMIQNEIDIAEKSGRTILKAELSERHRRAKEEESIAHTMAEAQANLLHRKPKKQKPSIFEMDVERDSWLRRIRQWLDPVDCKDFRKKVSKSRHPNTGECVMDTPEYKRWRRTGISASDVGDNLLWICGKPGSGKTYLSVRLLEDIELANDSESEAVAFYFCNWETRWAAHKLLATWLYQILVALPESYGGAIGDAYDMAMMYSTTAAARSQEELWDLLSIIIRLSERMTLVVDGIDELRLDSDEGYSVAETLSNLCFSNTGFRLLILGRENQQWLGNTFGRHVRLVLDRKLTSGDIEAYIRAKVEESGLMSDLSFDAATPLSIDEITEHLTHRAAGMFLWARLVLQVLTSDALSAEQRLDAFRSLTLVEGLDELYQKILELIMRQIAPARALATKVIMWILNIRGLRVEELQIAMAQSDHGPVNDRQIIQGLESQLPVVCGSLVEINAETAEVDFIHLSVHEYLEKKRAHITAVSTTMPVRRPSPGKASKAGETEVSQPTHIEHTLIARTCLNYILLTVPHIPLAGKLGEETTVDKISAKYPFLRCSSRMWIQQAAKAIEMTPHTENLHTGVSGLLSAMERLFSSRGGQLVWLEALCRYKCSPDEYKFADITAWKERWPAKTALWERLERFNKDVDNFQSSFSELLESQSTIHELWTGMTDFLSPDSILNENPDSFKLCEPKTPFAVDPLDCQLVWKVPQISHGGATLGLAVLWDCKTGKQYWDTSKYSVVVVQKWDISTHSEHHNDWVVQFPDAKALFPVAFSPDLKIIAVVASVNPPTSMFAGALSFFRASTQNKSTPGNAITTRLYSLQPAGSKQSGFTSLPVSELLKTHLQRDSPFSPDEIKHFNIIISQNNNYLAYYHSSKSSSEKLLLAVYDLTNFSRPALIFERKVVACDGAKPASGMIKADTAYRHRLPKQQFVAFHPTAPIIAWSTESETIVKRFAGVPAGTGTREPESKMEGYYIEKLDFSECGGFLIGRHENRYARVPIPSKILRDEELKADPRSEHPEWSPFSLRRRRSFLPAVPMPYRATELIRAEVNGWQYSLQMMDGAKLHRLDPSGGMETIVMARFPQKRIEGEHTKVIASNGSQTFPAEQMALIREDSQVTEVNFVLNCDAQAKEFPMIYRKRLKDMGTWKMDSGQNADSGRSVTELPLGSEERGSRAKMITNG